jgi:hypothetical protein
VAAVDGMQLARLRSCDAHRPEATASWRGRRRRKSIGNGVALPVPTA